MANDYSQSYASTLTTDQAIALTLMAENYWSNAPKDSESGYTKKIFRGRYTCYDFQSEGEHLSADHWQAVDRTETKRSESKVNASTITETNVAGLVFPFIYNASGVYTPLSFAFRKIPNLANWELITATPFTTTTLSRGAAILRPEDVENLAVCTRTFAPLWRVRCPTHFWPSQSIISPELKLEVIRGCCVVSRRYPPSNVTAFLYFAQSQLKVDLQTDPDVDNCVRDEFRSDWEVDFESDRCFQADASRIAFWEEVFSSVT